MKKGLLLIGPLFILACSDGAGKKSDEEGGPVICANAEDCDGDGIATVCDLNDNDASQGVNLTIPSCNETPLPPSSAVCGNGTREGTEECDDGNRVDTDACNNLCQNRVPPPPPAD